MPAHGFGKLDVPLWTRAQKTRMKKYISGKQTDWKKKTLAWARSEVKATGLVAQFYRCAYCRIRISDGLGMVEIDHIISKDHVPGFSYLRCNLVLTCKRCNNRKGRLNPTTLTLSQLSPRKRYVVDPRKYKWVHPYLHDYDEHVEISEGYVFSAKGGSPLGLALIKGCGLDKLPAVTKRQRISTVMSASNEVDAAFAVVGGFPLVPGDELADDLAARPDLSIDRSELVELIGAIRAGSLKDFLQATRAIKA